MNPRVVQVATEVGSIRRESSCASAIPTRDTSPRQLGDGSLSCGSGSADPRISG